MVYLRSILVPTDLSEYSLAALEYASSLRLLYASELVMLYVVESGVLHRSHPRGEGGEGSPEEGERAQQVLADFVARHVDPNLHVRPVVREGNAAEEIVRFAVEEGMDLVVMATHGRTGLRHILLGSVAERTVRLSRVPVLTVKPEPMREPILEEQDVAQELHLR